MYHENKDSLEVIKWAWFSTRLFDMTWLEVQGYLAKCLYSTNNHALTITKVIATSRLCTLYFLSLLCNATIQ